MKGVYIRGRDVCDADYVYEGYIGCDVCIVAEGQTGSQKFVMNQIWECAATYSSLYPGQYNSTGTYIASPGK